MASSDNSSRSLPQPMGTGEPIDPAKLRNLMAERGLSRLALANEVERAAIEQDIQTPHGHLVTCSRDAVSKWLKGNVPGGRRPKISTMVALCAALGCTREDLLYDDPAYGIPASAVADSLAGNTNPVTDLAEVIPPRALKELMLCGCLTFSDLADADANGKLIGITDLMYSPLNAIRGALADAAGFRSDNEDL